MLVTSPNNGRGGSGHGSTGESRWRRRFTKPGGQRVLGWVMIVIAVIGMAAAVLGVTVAWRLLSGLNAATTDTLAITIDALDSIDDTIDVADGTVTATSEALAELEVTLSTLAVSLESGADVVAETGNLTETAAPALADATVTLRQMEGIGSQIDGFLAAVAGIPFTPDFDQEAGLGATFGRLADDIDPLDEELAATARSLETFEASLSDLRSDVDELVITISRVNNELSEGEQLLAQYRANIAEAQAVARSSQADLTGDQSALRWLVLLAGLAFAVGQVVPLWLGLNLLATDEPPSPPDP